MVSVIIIDFKKVNPQLLQCLQSLGSQTYRDLEIILVTDYKNNLKGPKLIKKSYGRYVAPAKKRDDGAKIAQGEILAFIDDDAYSSPDWLKNIVRNFTDRTIAGVGGPGVTPPGVSWQEAASGWMSASPLGAGPYTYRFFPGKTQFVDDYPSMNLAVRKSDFLAVGGFDSEFYPGEDTKLCLDLVHKLGKRLIYDPKALVYHHRRPIWKAHLRQNGNYGLHRGFFARILPQTSLKPVYLCPAILVAGLLYLVFALFVPGLRQPYLYPLGWILFIGYLCALALNGLWVYQKSRSLFQGFLSILVVLVTHLWYGLRFLQGFFLTVSLPAKLERRVI